MRRQIAPGWFVDPHEINVAYQIDANGQPDAASRKRRFQDPKFEIDLYARCVREWFFRVASELQDERFDFIVLQSVITQIEAMETYRYTRNQTHTLQQLQNTCIANWSGKSDGARLFIQWLHSTVGCTYQEADCVWRSVRNSMFHAGFVGPGVLIVRRNLGAAVTSEMGAVCINPLHLLEVARTSFESSIAFLRETQTMHRHFMSVWLKHWGIDTQVRSQIIDALPLE